MASYVWVFTKIISLRISRNFIAINATNIIGASQAKEVEKEKEKKTDTFHETVTNDWSGIKLLKDVMYVKYGKKTNNSICNSLTFDRTEQNDGKI